ncbi:MAG: 50S ribosomal protein L23 [Flavobacteriaceae bacterium]|nr:50S ribosomal protein L23 [Flavobacteriaceae bacterium]
MKVIIKPIITEKVSKDSELYNRYGFEVDTKANKIQIKNAIQEMFGVTVTGVRTMNVGPDRKVKYTKKGMQIGKTNATKKALVQVAEGDTIDIYSNL